MRAIQVSVGRRLLSRASGVERGAAEKYRSVALRMIAGQDVPSGEIANVGHGAVGLGMGLDDKWNLVLTEPYYMAGQGVAVMELFGPIYWNAAKWECLLCGAMPTDAVVAAYKLAAADSAIQKLVVHMDCPGGSVSGAYDLAGAVADFQKTGKKLYVVAAEMMASMGVWVGCTADRIAVTPTGMVGSIGTLLMRYDDSRMFAELGIDPKPIASTERKTQGYPGVPLKDELADDDRRSIAKHYGEFADRVAAARGLTRADIDAMEARMYMGSDAVAAGLADEVTPTLDDFLARLVAGQVKDRPRGKAVPLPTPAPAPMPDPAPMPAAPEEVAMKSSYAAPVTAPEYRPPRVPVVPSGPSDDADENVFVAHVRRDWAANLDGCKSKCVGREDLYVAARKQEVTNRTGRRWERWGLAPEKPVAAEPEKVAAPMTGIMRLREDGFDEIRVEARRGWEANADNCRRNFDSEALYCNELLTRAGWSFGKRR